MTFLRIARHRLSDNGHARFGAPYEAANVILTRPVSGSAFEHES
jgi:hypothetical protein